MTTTVKVTSHNFPVRVRIVDIYNGRGTIADRVLFPEDGEQTFHATTTRTLEIIDLEYDDPQAKKAVAPQ